MSFSPWSLTAGLIGSGEHARLVTRRALCPLYLPRGEARPWSAPVRAPPDLLGQLSIIQGHSSVLSELMAERPLTDGGTSTDPVRSGSVPDLSLVSQEDCGGTDSKSPLTPPPPAVPPSPSHPGSPVGRALLFEGSRGPVGRKPEFRPALARLRCPFRCQQRYTGTSRVWDTAGCPAAAPAPVPVPPSPPPPPSPVCLPRRDQPGQSRPTESSTDQPDLMRVSSWRRDSIIREKLELLWL